MPSMRNPAGSTTSRPPSRYRQASVPGLTVSPHSFGRGNDARSMIRTRAPARASTAPATEPAGPAPTITTSSTSSTLRGPTAPDALHQHPTKTQSAPYMSQSAPYVNHQHPTSAKQHPTSAGYARPTTTALFFDPNPRQLHSAASIDADRP